MGWFKATTPPRLTIPEDQMVRQLNNALSAVAQAMNEADALGIDVSFSIKRQHETVGPFEVRDLVITKKLHV